MQKTPVFLYLKERRRDARMRRRLKKGTGKPSPGNLALQLRESGSKAYPDSVWTPRELMDSVYGIPLDGNLPLQYILGVDVLALGRCMSLVGSYGCSKSSLGWYLAKLFLEWGGMVVSIDTEHKQNPDQIRAIVDNDELFDTVVYTKADSLDQMLDKMFFYTKEYEKIIPDKSVPMLLLVDSLNAVTSEDASKKRMSGENTAGYAGARNAGEIQEAMKSFVPKCLDKNPILGVVINHQKSDLSKMVMPGMPTPKKEPGGIHKDFMYTWKLELAKATTRKSVFGETPIFKIKAGKSSLGTMHKYSISVPYTSRFDEDGLEHIAYDWDEALAHLLTGDAVSKTALKDVMHLVKTGSKFKSDTLGLKDVSATELGAAIHANAELCEELKQKVLHIRKKRVIGEELADVSGYDEEAVGAVEEETAASG